MNFRKRFLTILTGAAILAGSLLPVAWTLILSLKPSAAGFYQGAADKQWSLEAYRMVLGEEIAFGAYIWNGLIVASISSLAAVLISGLAAFSLVSLRFRYRLSALSMILLAGLAPPVAIIAPTFSLMNSLNLAGTLAGLILPNIAYNTPIATWILISYLSKIPREVEDAARMDGATSTGVMWLISFPLALPGIFVALSLAFLGAWGEFMVASTVSLGKPAASTTPVGLLGLSQAFELQWSWVSAGIVLSLIPVVTLTLLFTQLLNDTAASSAAKG